MGAHLSADGFVEGKPNVHDVFGKKVTAEMERKTCGLLGKGVFPHGEDSPRKGGEACPGESGPRMLWSGCVGMEAEARPASAGTGGQEDRRTVASEADWLSQRPPLGALVGGASPKPSSPGGSEWAPCEPRIRPGLRQLCSLQCLALPVSRFLLSL